MPGNDSGARGLSRLRRNMTSTAAALVERPLRNSALIATIATVVLGGALIAYAALTPTGAPPELDEETRTRLLSGAVAATFCMIPGLLFTARVVQWWRRRGPHPSVSLALLATIAMYPLILSLLIVFAL